MELGTGRSEKDRTKAEMEHTRGRGGEACADTTRQSIKEKRGVPNGPSNSW